MRSESELERDDGCAAPREQALVQVIGADPSLVEGLEEPLRAALGNRRAFYSVRIEAIGRGGDVVVSITSIKGHVPLFIGRDELDPGFVEALVRDTVSQLGL